MPLPTLDTHEFTRRGDAAEGSEPVAAFERLVSLLADDTGVVAWRVSGRSELGPDGSRREFLRLSFAARVRMRCVRCLEPVEVPLEADRPYRLVATEAQAEREDPDEDDVDLLVSSRRFDLGGLLEDEAILALPAAPRHDACDPPRAVGLAPAEPADDPAEVAPSRPFDALRGLRGHAAPVDPGPAAPEGDGPPDDPPTPSRRRGR